MKPTGKIEAVERIKSFIKATMEPFVNDLIDDIADELEREIKAEPVIFFAHKGEGIYVSTCAIDERSIVFTWDELADHLQDCDLEVLQKAVPKMKELVEKLEQELRESEEDDL